MKYKIIFLFGLFQFIGYGQSHYAGQYSLGVNYGFVSKGTNYNLNVQKLIGNKFFGVRADLDWLQQDYILSFYGTENYSGTFDSKRLGVAATYSLERIIPHPFYVQLYLGALYSNENLKDFSVPQEVMPSYNRNNFGAYAGTEIEIVLFPSFSLTGSFKYQNVFQSTIDKELIFGQVGIKLNF